MGEMCLCGILDDGEPPSGTEVGHGIHVDHQAVEVHRHDGGRSLRDGSGRSVEVDVPIVADVDESDRDISQEIVDYFRNMGTRIVGCIAMRS